jgi:glycosyltransferase involved in cell wall biosynthesis
MNISEDHQIVFSVIVPVYHGGNFLRDLLHSIHKLNFPLKQFEVIVAGDESDVKSRKIVEAETRDKKFNIAYIESSKSGKAAKLNATCTQARGRFLFFIDDDCILLPNCLKSLERVIQRETNIGVIGGTDELEESDSTFELALDCILNSFVGTGGLRKKTGVKVGEYYPRLWNMTVPMDVITNMNLKNENGRLQIFNESLLIYEDVDLVKRIIKAGKKILFAPEVSVKHRRNTNFFSFVTRNIKSVRVSKALGIHFYPQIILGIFVFWLIIGGILSLYFNNIRLLFLSSLATYILLLFFIGIKGGIKKRSFRVFLYVPLLLFSLHFSRGFTYLILWPAVEKEI